ncbi:lipid II:glycine glycyltransferase FemX [Nesterenkonia populi]
MSAVTIRPIAAEEHLGFLASRPEANFLQNPHWARVSSWRSQALGIWQGENLVGTALVLGKRVPIPERIPVLGRKHFAYIPEGPVIDPAHTSYPAVLPALTEYLKSTGAFLIRMGLPTVARRWSAGTIRDALAAEQARTIPDVEPDHVDEEALALQAELIGLGWKDLPISMSLEAGWPQFQARIPLASEDGEPLDVDDVLAGMSSSARKSMRKSARSGVEVTRHGTESLEDFYALHLQTAQRHGFTPRPKEGVRTLMEALSSSGIAQTTIFLASSEGQQLATSLYVGQGETGHALYAGSSEQQRKLEAPIFLKLQQIEYLVENRLRWFNLGGVSPSLERTEPTTGITQFKTKQGAELMQTLGEWDYAVDPVIAAAYRRYRPRK